MKGSSIERNIKILTIRFVKMLPVKKSFHLGIQSHLKMNESWEFHKLPAILIC